ncbi:MAG: hypothetical protein ACT4O0_02030 [Pseudonocardia sp.]|jgi:hypothetical protein
MTELDAAGPAMAALAALAERGECIERAMLREAPRTACEQAVAAWRSDWAGYRDIRDRAVAASRMIATFGADQQGYRAAVSEFALAQDELARTRSRCGRSHNRAQSAMAQLEHDQLLRQRHAHEIEQGRRARAELDELLEARLAEALDWGWSMPAWFTSALGAGPPPDGDAGWRATAVRLLSYRITYAVCSPDRALGARPGPSACSRRRQWFAELDRELARVPVHPSS